MKERVPSGPQRPIPLGESTCPPLQSRSPSSSHPFPNPRPSSDQPSDLSSPETGRGVEDAGTPPQPSQLAQSPFMSAPNLSLSSKGDALLSSTSGQVALGVSNWPQPQQQQQQQQQQQLQPLQQGQLSVTAAGQSTELLTDLQAVELKLYELQQLQLQLQQQQLLLQQQLLQQKHQHSMQQWGLQDTTPAPEYSTGELQPVLQMGRQPSKSGALSPVQNRQENGVNSNNASVMAAELHGDAAGAERAGVCLEGQQIKREISTATSVSLDTNISEMKAEDLSALFGSASKDAMALMNRAGGGAHAGGLPPLDNSSDMQRRRNQAAIRRLHPNYEPKGKSHMAQPSRLSWQQEPIRHESRAENTLARERRPSTVASRPVPSLPGTGASSEVGIRADIERSERISSGTRDRSSSFTAHPFSRESVCVNIAQQQQQQQQQQEGDAGSARSPRSPFAAQGAGPPLQAENRKPPSPCASHAAGGGVGEVGEVEQCTGGFDTAAAAAAPSAAATGPKGLFADEDDDEAKKNDMLKAFTQKKAPWYKIAYWRWLMVTLAIAMAMFIVGVVLQNVVEEQNDGNTESFRWLYFFALAPPLWYFIDICCQYLFMGIEWWLFRESLLYLKNVQRYTVVFILLLLLLLWHAVIFEWAWCEDEDRCNAESYHEAITVLWNLQICFVLFALANVLKSVGAKFLSTHFYRTAHFKKLQAAIEKEHFLQVLSRPSATVRARKQERAQEDGTGSKTQQQRPAFKLAQVTNLGNLLKRGALGRNSTALQQKGSGGDGDALRAAAGTAVEGQAAYPAEVLHATAAEKTPNQPPPPAPSNTLSALKSAPSALLNAGFKVVASAVGAGGSASANIVEGGVADESQQASLLQDAKAQELADLPSNAATTELFLSDSHVHIIGVGNATRTPPPPPGLPAPPPPSPPAHSRQEPLSSDTSNHSHVQQPQPQLQPQPLPCLQPLPQQPQQAPTSEHHSSLEAHSQPQTTTPLSPVGDLRGMMYSNAMFDAWRAHSMQRAHSHAAMTPEGPSVSGAAAAAWDNTHFSEQYEHADGDDDDDEDEDGDNDDARHGRPPYATGPPPHYGYARKSSRREAPDAGKMPAIREPLHDAYSDSDDSECDDSASSEHGPGGASELHRPLHMPSQSGPALQRMATTTTTRRIASRAILSDPDGAPDGRASAANPLGPMGDVLMETVPLQNTDKKDLARMTDTELERVRTAIVIKTYTAIIRNYSNMSPEEQDAELARVRAFSRALFYNIRGDEDRQYVSAEDFDCFFPDDPELSRRAFRVFDADNDNHVTRKEIKEAVVAIYRERANMAASLKDTDSIVQSLEYAIGCLIHFIFLAFYLLIWEVDIVKGFSTFSAMLLAFTFIFGNSVKNMFESMLFLFVEHPYDVGDTVLIKTELYRVKKISLLYTEFIQINGERIFIPNTDLMASIISNWTRTKTKTEFVRIQMDVGVPPDVLADIMNALVTHAAANSTEFDGAPFVQYREVLEHRLKLVLQISWTYAFPPDDWQRLVPARNAMVGILQTKLKAHKVIQYTENWKVQKNEEGV